MRTPSERMGRRWVYSHIGIESRTISLTNGPQEKFNRRYRWLRGKMVKKPEPVGALNPLLEDDALRSTFRRRKDEYEYYKALFDEEKELLKDNWLLHKRTQSHLWLKRAKSAEVLLEDRIWCLFYRMGYPRISGPKFRIEYKSNDGSTGLKRIDVLAADDETVIVVECRARENRGRRTLQKDIEDLEGLQKKLSQVACTRFG